MTQRDLIEGNADLIAAAIGLLKSPAGAGALVATVGARVGRHRRPRRPPRRASTGSTPGTRAGRS